MILDHPVVPLSHTPLKVAFFTGLSNPASCCLSWPYQQFMAQLDCPEVWKLYLNFPYIPSAEDEEKVGILQASWANSWQFLRARSPRYRQAVQRHFSNLLASTDQLFLLVGSCGLEILNQAWPETIVQDRVSVVAFGPVAYRCPWTTCTLIQGDQDAISRFFFREVEVLLPEVGHMDYVDNSQFFEWVNQALARTISTL
jgi:hypothetical protein